jgi:hypothetical protein
MIKQGGQEMFKNEPKVSGKMLAPKPLSKGTFKGVPDKADQGRKAHPNSPGAGYTAVARASSSRKATPSKPC